MSLSLSLKISENSSTVCPFFSSSTTECKKFLINVENDAHHNTKKDSLQSSRPRRSQKRQSMQPNRASQYSTKNHRIYVARNTKWQQEIQNDTSNFHIIHLQTVGQDYIGIHSANVQMINHRVLKPVWRVSQQRQFPFDLLANLNKEVESMLDKGSVLVLLQLETNLSGKLHQGMQVQQGRTMTAVHKTYACTTFFSWRKSKNIALRKIILWELMEASLIGVISYANSKNLQKN